MSRKTLRTIPDRASRIGSNQLCFLRSKRTGKDTKELSRLRNRLLEVNSELRHYVTRCFYLENKIKLLEDRLYKNRLYTRTR